MDTISTNISRKVIVILLFVLSFIIIVLAFGLLRLSSPAQSDIQGQQPSSNNYESTITSSVQTTPTPDDRAIEFTGYLEETYTAGELDRINQTNTLREASPFDAGLFIVTFNYRTLKFDVSLRGNPSLVQEQFELWRTQNYPAIPPEMFVSQ